MDKKSAGLRLKMHAPAITAEVCAERFGGALRRWTSDMRNASKRVARQIDADPRVVENYIYGRHCPPAAKLIELMAECQELADEVNRLVQERRAARENE
jgi:predicted transcriptional regulator